ncbi:hypothetical protein FEM03_07610 [Phragmitibacter flavus]|uniref:Uncharacterized protein n=2 Tax=Phragmitibacter flavus TaxID=2576071 RepID=A0A5R8KGE9_9BACT|nr:hypothetical protein FEM03_07610 [Phragmitibacter flavus]
MSSQVLADPPPLAKRKFQRVLLGSISRTEESGGQVGARHGVYRPFQGRKSDQTHGKHDQILQTSGRSHSEDFETTTTHECTTNSIISSIRQQFLRRQCYFSDMKGHQFKNLTNLSPGINFGDLSVWEKIKGLEENIPGLVRDYVKTGLPSCSVDSDGLELLGSTRFVEHNTKYSPAIFIRPLGFWTIATTFGGDAFVVDTEKGDVLLVDTGMLFYDNGIPTGLGAAGKEPITRDFVLKTSQIEASSWVEFLNMI